MKKLTISFVLLLMATCTWAQFISSQKAIVEDYIPLFENAGYKVHSFDISALEKEDATFLISPEVKHYRAGVDSAEIIALGIGFTNREMLSQYSEQYRAEVIKEGDLYNAEKGIHKLYKKLLVSFCPIDKGKQMIFRIDKFNLGFPLMFSEQVSPSGEVNKTYYTREFIIDNMKFDEFIPLVLLGAPWYDPDIESFRFCGEDHISPEMKEDFIKSIPEYYVIGARVTKCQ